MSFRNKGSQERKDNLEGVCSLNQLLLEYHTFAKSNDCNASMQQNCSQEFSWTEAVQVRVPELRLEVLSVYDLATELRQMPLSVEIIVREGSVVQSLSHVQLFATPWTAARQASLPFTVSQSLLKLKSVESMMPSNHLILCCPLLLPSVFPIISVFSGELALLIRWPKYWSFSFSINPSNEYSGLISFRIDWFDLLAVQGTVKSLL